MQKTSGGPVRWLRRKFSISGNSVHNLRTNFDVHQGNLTPRRLSSFPGNRWQRWWRGRSRAKLLIMSTAAGVLLVVTLLGARFTLTANKIIVRDEGAAAINQDVDPSQLNIEGDGRINILLIGIGGQQHVAGNLSDSIMVISLDPLSKDVTMLTIPRDLYLQIGDYGANKINAAHVYGEDYDYPGGGPRLLMDTISFHLGVPIHYYTRLDFEGFRQAVNTVGGIELEVKQAINDPAYPDEDLSGFEPFSIAAGQHHLDGNTALKFARSRHTTNDFDRGSRQQQLLVALKDKALSLGTLLNPLKINGLLSAIGDHVRTNISVDDVMKLAEMGKEVDNGRVQRAVLDNSPENYLATQTINSISALVPRSGDFSQLKNYVRHLMPDGYLHREAARITVLNGTSRSGLGEQTAELLRSLGYLVVRVDNAAARDYQQTILHDRTDGRKRYTLNYLQKRFGVKSVPPAAEADMGSDITLIIGSDSEEQL